MQQIRPSNTTINTCTDFSCNTTNTNNNVNKNINNSGNTSVSTIAQVTPVYQTPVQHPVQCVFPQPVYIPPQQYDYRPPGASRRCFPRVTTCKTATATNRPTNRPSSSRTSHSPQILYRIRPRRDGQCHLLGRASFLRFCVRLPRPFSIPAVATALAGRQRWLRARFDRVGSCASRSSNSVSTESTSGSSRPAIFAETPRAESADLPDPSAIEAEFSRFIGAMPKDKMSFAKAEEGQACIIITRN